MSRREPEPVLPVAKMFPRRIFQTAPGIRLSWEALSSGLEALNARQDAQPSNGIRRRRAPATT